MTVARENEPPKSEFSGRSILVTGGTGSFGRRFCKELLQHHHPKRLIIFSRGEMQQFEMQQDAAFKNNSAVRFFIGDVRDAERLEMAMRGVDIVIHCAALKQVPAAEYNPFECIKTNVHGAENVVTAAIKTNVSKVIALSTDKAVNPVNLYGASKLASDKIFVGANTLSGTNGPRFSVVRYGNVFGSRGSVVPFFKQAIAAGAKELPITDIRMSRFIISLQQSCQFVIDCAKHMRGGEVFIPKIPSVMITDIAKWLAPSLPIKIVGIRPGEKLHEALITEDHARNCYDMGSHYVLAPEFQFWGDQGLSLSKDRLVPEGFVYASGTNSDWINQKQFLDLLSEE